MNTRTVVTVIAAALFSVSLVSTSSAQDYNRSAPDGIEVITIVAKRPAAMPAILAGEALVPMSRAQDNNRSAPEGIEVITVVGKRPALTAALACVNAVTARTGAATGRNFSEQLLASGRTGISSVRRAIKRCIEQDATPFEGHI